MSGHKSIGNRDQCDDPDQDKNKIYTSSDVGMGNSNVTHIFRAFLSRTNEPMLHLRTALHRGPDLSWLCNILQASFHELRGCHKEGKKG